MLQFVNDMLVKITGGQQQVGSLQELADGQVLANILLKCELAPASLCKFVPQSVEKLKAIVQSLNAIKDKQVVDRLLDTAEKIDPSLLMMKAYTVDDKIQAIFNNIDGIKNSGDVDQIFEFMGKSDPVIMK